MLQSDRFFSASAPVAGTRVSLRSLRGFALLCAAATAVLGVGTLLGWVLNSGLLKSVLPGHISMKANTAVCFMLAAAGLAAAPDLRAVSRRWVDVCAVAVLLCAGSTLFEYLMKVNLHVDEVLFRDPVHSLYPGRMAAISAVNFCLTGVALLLQQRGSWGQRGSQGIGAMLFAVSFASVTGYGYGVPVLYGSTVYTAMALHTGVGFLLLSAGFLLMPADSLLATVLTTGRGGWLIRRSLPWVLLLPPLLGWVYLRPGVNFGSAVFSMALFAVTLALAGTGVLYVLANFLNREERYTAELHRVREESAAAVRHSEQELRLITDQLPILLSYIDRDGRFVRVNQTYEHWMGRGSEEIVGRSVRELLGESYWESTAVARELMWEGKIVTFDASYPTVEGLRDVQVTYAPDCDEEGKLRGVACLVLDVHERHQAEAALRQSEKLAAVGRLASSIAHEINNPLEAITNLLYLAELETGCGYVVQAQAELARVNHIVTQTLRFHRQSTGPVFCSVPDLVRQILVLYQGKVVQGRVAVECRLREHEPLRCHDGEIRQVLANLIGNAVEAMRGGGRLLLRVTAARQARTRVPGVRITIADSGHGISEETRRTLFQPFHTTKGATGSGLGLWISNDIVQRHGGSLTVRSCTRAGQSGTVFRVFLPGLEAQG